MKAKPLDPLDYEDPRHGTHNGYTNLRCRCGDCTEANAIYHRNLYQIRKRQGLSPDDERHGTENAYKNWGCHCRPCQNAWAIACREQVSRRKERSRHNAKLLSEALAS